MQQLGQATWRAENGEIIGTPSGPDGGWLLLENGYQDVQFAALYRMRRRSAPPASWCDPKRAGWDEGASTRSSPVTSDRRLPVTVGPAGQHPRHREPLARQRRRAGALCSAASAAERGASGRGGGGGGGRAGRDAAARIRRGSCRCSRQPPDSSYRATDWNRVEIVVDVDVFRSNVNGRGSGVAIDGATGSFGPIALHVAASARFASRTSRSRISRAGSPRPNRPAPRFRAQHFEDLLLSAGRPPRGTSITTASARRDDRQPLLPRAVVHGIAGGLRGPAYNPAKEDSAGDGQLRVRLHRRRLGRHPGGRIRVLPFSMSIQRGSPAAGRATPGSRRPSCPNRSCSRTSTVTASRTRSTEVAAACSG